MLLILAIGRIKMNINLSKNQSLLMLLVLFLIIVVCYIIFWIPDSKESISSQLIDNKSVSAIGINFDTGKSIALDPYSEEEILPCKKRSISSEGKDTKGIQKCKINENEIIASELVLNAIKNSREIFEGFVINGDKKIPAKFTISVSALYEGSMCHTYWSTGDQLENCISVRRRCNDYVVNKFGRINTSKDPEGLTRQCKALNSAWPADYVH
jgi:hypothetical protein